MRVNRNAHKISDHEVAFTSDQQEDPHAQNHVAVERPVLIGQPDHLREHPSTFTGPVGPIRGATTSGNDVPSRWRRREATRRGRDWIFVPLVGVDRNCIFKRPSTFVLSACLVARRSCDRISRSSDRHERSRGEQSTRKNAARPTYYPADRPPEMELPVPDMAITTRGRFSRRGCVSGASALPPITFHPEKPTSFPRDSLVAPQGGPLV